MRGNAELVFDPGNQFGPIADLKPYFGLPGWWRHFLFRVLTQRDVAVYVYLCSLMDVHDVCYPTTEQIREDIGVDSPTTIFTALSNLERRGFILRRRQRLPGRVYKFQRNIYQRPAVEYTLETLLGGEFVDAHLRAINPVTKLPYLTESSGRSERVVEKGLENLLGAAKYVGYAEAPENEKLYTLRVLLEDRLTERRAELGPKAAALASESKIRGVVIDGKRYRRREVEEINAAAASGKPMTGRVVFNDDEPSGFEVLIEDEEIEESLPF